MKNLLLVLGEMACDIESIIAFASDDFVDSSILQDCQVIILHPIADARYDDKTTQIQYEIGTELGVATLLLNAVLENKAFNNNATNARFLKQILDRLSSFDFGNICSESAFSQEEIHTVISGFFSAQNRYILLGRAFAYHKDKKLISKILGLLSKYTSTNIINENENIKVLDLDFLDEIESKLENLPESNGAFVYLSPQDVSNIDLIPTLEATKQFIALSKCKNGEVISLKKPPISLACKVAQSPYLRGIVGIIPSASIDCYPFIPFQDIEVSKEEI